MGFTPFNPSYGVQRQMRSHYSMSSDSGSSRKVDQPAFVVGLLAAVTGAAVFFATYRGANAWLSTTGPVGNPFLILAVLAVTFWIMAIWSAALPCYFVYRLAGRFGIRSIVYFVLCGALTALLLDPLFVAVLPHMFLHRDIPSFTEEYVFQAPALVFSGVGGGLTYWLLLRRHLAYRTGN
jgi:hypothetical protein